MIRKMYETWDRYWFEPKPLHGLALFRIALGLLLFSYFFDRYFFAEKMYSNLSFKFVMEEFQKLPLFSTAAVEWLLIALLVSAACFTIGFCTKWANLVLVGLVYYFGSLESMCTAGCFNLMLISAILMLFAPAGRFGSVDYLFYRWRHGAEKAAARQLGPIWVQRLIVLQLAIVYLSSSICKSFYASGWWSGEYLKDNMLDPYFGQMPVGLWLSDQAWLLPFASSFSLLLEFSLPILILTPQLRPFGMALGILFHLMILLAMNITPIFSLVMFAFYILVIPSERWKIIFDWGLVQFEKFRIRVLTTERAKA